MTVPRADEYPGESGRFEKPMVQERSDIHIEESLGSGDYGLSPNHIINKDNPLVSLSAANIIVRHTNKLQSTGTACTRRILSA